ncbi:MAG: Flp pilus assembly protein CpaB [Rhodospirillales bacterium]|nr:Flp pilus assembly protein CpaB [Rhodospirillales bacterium]MCB9979700.1 Flp pilus assembly protein CpaB [Rhodospirillales bacterium]
MNKNILIVMGGGLLVAILVATLVKFGMDGGSKVIETEGKVDILVAAQDLRIGEELSDNNMKWAGWPEGSVFSGAIRRKDKDQSLSDALSGRLARNVAKDEPLMRSATIKEDKGNFVAAILKPDHRAVAISVKAESMVGGFITPGDFVDVILTYKIKFDDEDDPIAKMVINQNIDEYATETILQNVKILAIDQTSNSDDVKIKVAKTVTLEVNDLGAEKLALASEMGPLTLALRGIGDDKISAEDRAVTTDIRMTRISEQLLDEYKKVRNGEHEDAPHPSNNVRIYSGGSVDRVTTR